MTEVMPPDQARLVREVILIPSHCHPEQREGPMHFASATSSAGTYAGPSARNSAVLSAVLRMTAYLGQRRELPAKMLPALRLEHTRGAFHAHQNFPRARDLTDLRQRDSGNLRRNTFAGTSREQQLIILATV